MWVRWLLAAPMNVSGFPPNSPVRELLARLGLSAACASSCMRLPLRVCPAPKPAARQDAPVATGTDPRLVPAQMRDGASPVALQMRDRVSPVAVRIHMIDTGVSSAQLGPHRGSATGLTYPLGRASSLAGSASAQMRDGVSSGSASAQMRDGVGSPCIRAAA